MSLCFVVEENGIVQFCKKITKNADLYLFSSPEPKALRLTGELIG